MQEGTTSRVMEANRPCGEFYDFYVSPEYFGYTLLSIGHNRMLRQDFTTYDVIPAHAYHTSPTISIHLIQAYINKSTILLDVSILLALKLHLNVTLISKTGLEVGHPFLLELCEGNLEGELPCWRP
jgi:hypothetical protein